MKKRFTALLLVLSLFGVTESQVLAGPSAGGKCVTVGKFATVNATTLVCTKIGSAKVWVALDKSAFAAPTVVSVAIAPSSTLTYYLQGQTIYVIVQFSSPVFVTGVPQIFLDSANIGKMSYIAGSGTSALLFAYVTVAGDVDNDGFGLKANSLTLNGGTIKDANGTAANLTHVSIAKSSTRKLTATAPATVATTTTVATGATTTTVATTTTTTAATTTTTTTSAAAPTISSVAFKEPTNEKWIPGQSLQVRIIFNAPVVVTGSPYISLLSDGISRATYLDGSGGTSLIFAYTILSGDIDNTGVGIAANSIVLNSGTIKSASGVNATLTHSAVARSSTRKILAS
ncbi:MAG: hypothetical protein EB142_04260 [Actinobacteria bacterium]|nr:hypothetical protein [Actinomycetota bacterium]